MIAIYCVNNIKKNKYTVCLWCNVTTLVTVYMFANVF